MDLLLLMFSVLIRQHLHNRFQTKDRVKEHIGKANILPVHFNVVLHTCFFPILVLLLFLHSKPSAVWLQGRVTVVSLMESFLGIWGVTEKKIILMEKFYSKPYIGVLSRTFSEKHLFSSSNILKADWHTKWDDTNAGIWSSQSALPFLQCQGKETDACTALFILS